MWLLSQMADAESPSMFVSTPDHTRGAVMSLSFTLCHCHSHNDSKTRISYPINESHFSSFLGFESYLTVVKYRTEAVLFSGTRVVFFFESSEQICGRCDSEQFFLVRAVLAFCSPGGKPASGNSPSICKSLRVNRPIQAAMMLCLSCLRPVDFFFLFFFFFFFLFLAENQQLIMTQCNCPCRLLTEISTEVNSTTNINFYIANINSRGSVVARVTPP